MQSWPHNRLRIAAAKPGRVHLGTFGETMSKKAQAADAGEIELAERLNDIDETVKEAVAEIKMVAGLAIHRLHNCEPHEAAKLKLAFDLITIRCEDLERKVERAACGV